MKDIIVEEIEDIIEYIFHNKINIMIISQISFEFSQEDINLNE